jgi:hypothetical protein
MFFICFGGGLMNQSKYSPVVTIRDAVEKTRKNIIGRVIFIGAVFEKKSIYTIPTISTEIIRKISHQMFLSP